MNIYNKFVSQSTSRNIFILNINIYIVYVSSVSLSLESQSDYFVTLAASPIGSTLSSPGHQLFASLGICTCTRTCLA